MTDRQVRKMIAEADGISRAAESTTAVAVQWRYYSYDVLGNAKDGYDVNNVFRTSDVIEIPESVGGGDAELFAHLKAIGFFNKPRLQARFFETDHNVACEDTIYFYYKGRPEGEFRREEVGNAVD